jgi:hypothetical protein
MANPGRLVASLTVVGEMVDPQEISNLVGAQPDRTHRVGDPVSTRSEARQRTGLWSISTEARMGDHASLSEHIRELLGRVTRDQDVWRALATSHSARVFVGWFMDGENEGDGVEPDVMEELARLSLPLDLDVYSAGPAGGP